MDDWKGGGGQWIVGWDGCSAGLVHLKKNGGQRPPSELPWPEPAAAQWCEFSLVNLSKNHLFLTNGNNIAGVIA